MATGSDQHFSWDYSERSDILNIHRAGKMTAGGAELGDFTVDFDKGGDVVGVEIMNASDFFSQVGISGGELATLKAAEIIVNKRAAYSLILVKLFLPQRVDVIPLPAPIVAEAAV